MLGKLFKYDMRALSKVLLPVHGAVLAVGLLGVLAAFVGYTLDDMALKSTSVEVTIGMMTAVMAAVMLFSLLAMIIAAGATLVVIIHRFYKNLFTDEGYLTLTLPASANQVVLAKLLAGLLWSLIDLAVVCLLSCMVSWAAYGMMTVNFEDTLPYWLLSVQGSGSLLGGGGGGSALLGIVNMLIQLVSTLCLVYVSFALGAVVAKVHRVAAGIGLYCLLAWGVSLLGTIGTIVVTVLFTSFGNYEYEMASAAHMASTVLGWVLHLCLAAVSYVVCVRLIERKLDLP